MRFFDAGCCRLSNPQLGCLETALLAFPEGILSFQEFPKAGSRRRRAIQRLFSKLKIDFAGIGDSFRGGENLKRNEIAVFTVVENDAGFILIAFMHGCIVF